MAATETAGRFGVRRSSGVECQLGLRRGGVLAPQAAQELADGFFIDTQAPRDFTVGAALLAKFLNPLRARGRQARPAARVTVALSQCGQAAVLEASLLPAHGARSVTEGAGHIVLIGPALFDQTHHGVRLGHAVPHGILGQDDARDDDDPVAILGSEQASIINDLHACRIR